MFSLKKALWPFLLLASCNWAIGANYNISGKISGFKNGSKVYLLDEESEMTLNSTPLSSGNFYLHGTLKNGPVYLTVRVQEGHEKYEVLVFAGLGKIVVSGNKNDFPYNLTISGPAEQLKYNEFNELLKPLNIQVDKAMAIFDKAGVDSIATRNAGNAVNAIADKRDILIRNWIVANLQTYLAVNQLFSYLPNLSPDSIQKIYARLKPALKKSIYGKHINLYLNKGDTLKIGDKYFDFAANDALGKTVHLSAFVGKYILLDFTSEFCGPCKESIDELRLLSQKYREQLVIISFTLDKHADWLKQIKNDHITWPTVIDMDGPYSKTLMKYKVHDMPNFCLIAPDGRISDKWTGYKKINSNPGDLEKHLVRLSR